MREPEESSLAAEAYTVVRQRILRGELALGQVLSRRQLALELGMSFLPVSEALLRLEFEGLLESRPRAGTRVRIPTPDDVQGHYVLREALEVKAAMLFAEHATPSERSELRKLAARVDLLSTQSDRVVYLTVHQKLHRRIAECTHCAVLCRAIEQTHALASTWFCLMQRQSAPESARRHQDLVEVLASGDPQRAGEAMRAHIVNGMRHVMQALEPYFRMRKSGRTFRRGERARKQVALPATVN